MQIYNLESEKTLKSIRKDSRNFIICSEEEIIQLQHKFGLDRYTIEECTDDEDKVIFLTYDRYDFISFVNLHYNNSELKTDELNIYVGMDFLILVLPERSAELANPINEYIKNNKALNLNKIYHQILNLVIENISGVLGNLEDDLKRLEIFMLNHRIDNNVFLKVNHFKNTTYKGTKWMRSLSYIGGQIVVNVNQFVKKESIKLFHNIDTRLTKLVELATFLSKKSDSLLNIYDSRQNAKTNDVITKLTVITIFFGPLTIITGIYGMNFKHMPELSWMWGYPFAIGIMLSISLVIYVLLKKRKLL